MNVQVDVSKKIKKADNPPPVIIHLQNIPETRQTVSVPSPLKPSLPSGAPIETLEDITPENITIEDTNLKPQGITPQIAPLSVPGTAQEEKEIFEYYDVEEVPVRVKNIVPEYPEMAQRAGIEGSITLKVLVNKKGDVDSVEVIDGPSVFRKAAVEAAKATKFKPAKYNDKTVSCWVIMPFKFKLDN